MATVSCSLPFLSCDSHQPASPTTEQELNSALVAVVDDKRSIFSAAMHLDAPTLGLSWEAAAGVADRSSGEPMLPSTPVLIASNTKTFISASILRLWEQGSIELDASISTYLPDHYVSLLQIDGYEPDDITVRHLLTHTGGLFDYASADEYNRAIHADPTHRWTRTEQLEFAMAWGSPLGEPGDVVYYSDTGYILLGEILEQVTGTPMAESVRALVGYERIGLEETWFESLEPRPEGISDLAHQFWAGVDVTTIDPSNDLYGGGGLAATVGDLATFMRALFTGGVFDEAATVDTMLSTAIPGSDRPLGIYRLGVAVMELGGYTAYCHSGFLGTLAAYVPALDLAIGLAVNQTEAEDEMMSLADAAIEMAGQIDSRRD